MTKKERPSQENESGSNLSPEEQELKDELSAAQEEIEKERTWRKEANLPEASKEEIASAENLKPREVAEMIEADVSNEAIWEAAQQRGRFYKFDGSSYFVSEKLSDPERGAFWWKTESAAGNTGGAGHRQADMFADKIKKSLEDYRDLLDSFESADHLFAAIDYLKEQNEKVTKKALLELAVSEQDPVEEPDVRDEEKVGAESTEEKSGTSAAEPEPDEKKQANDAEEAAEGKEGKESTEQPPKFSVGDTVHRKINGARRWSEPRDVKSVILNEEKDWIVKTEGDNSYHPEDEFELAGNPEISADVAEEFDSQFDISVEDLSTIPGFEELSGGQQKLVLDNFRQLTLSRVEEEGIEEYRKDKVNSSAVAGMWKGFMSSYYKNKHVTETGKKLLSGGIDIHKEALADVVYSTKESGLDLDENGELVFARPNDIEDLTEEEKAIVEEFNDAAQAFTQTAVEWEYEDGWSKLTGGNREAYQDQRNQYEEALNHYIDLLSDRKGVFPGLKEGAEIDKKVRFAQFFAGDSKYENALQNIKDDASWKRLMGSIGREKGTYMAMGMVSRTSAVGLINTIAAPIVATGIGGAVIGAGFGAYKGRRSAVETLEDDAMLGSGGGQEQSNIINTVPAEQLTQKLRNLIDKVEDPNISREERGEIAASLARRIRYTEQKINGGTYVYEDQDGNEQVAELSGGLVDYGDVESRSGRQYQLLQTLNEARAITVVHDQEVNEEINNRLDKYLDYKDEKTRSYVKRKTKRGAIYAGAFGGVLGTLSGLAIFGGDEAADVADSGNEGGGSSLDAEIIGGNEGGGEAVADTTGAEGGGEAITTDSAGGGEEIPTPEIDSQQITIDESGEGMIHAIADKLEADYGLSHEKAMEIGNELFVEGEQLKGDAEMFNLVGEGATFSVDFGELTPADLQEQPAEKLADEMSFDQDTFETGDAGIKGEELSEAESEASVDKSSSIEAADINKENTFFNSDGPAERSGISPEEFQEWKEEMQSEGVVMKDGVEAESAAEDTSGSTAAQSETAGVEAAASVAGEETLQAEVDAVSVNHLRSKVAYADALLQTNSDLVADIPQTRLNVLNNLLERYNDLSASESIIQIGEDDPRLLTVLERALTADHIDGDPLSQNDQNVLTFVRYQVSQLTVGDFEGNLPAYVQESMTASQQVEQ